jgi:hypothetical protein
MAAIRNLTHIVVDDRHSRLLVVFSCIICYIRPKQESESDLFRDTLDKLVSTNAPCSKLNFQVLLKYFFSDALNYKSFLRDESVMLRFWFFLCFSFLLFSS